MPTGIFLGQIGVVWLVAVCGVWAATQWAAAALLAENPALVATFAERQALVQKPLFDELDRRYAV